MSKVDLDPITSGYNLSKINSNFQRIEEELNNKVLYREVEDGEPNHMSDNLDMNSNDILNADFIGAGEISTSVLELGGVQVVPSGLSVDFYNGTREALRRSYAEAGYNLVAGSFEVGGTLNSRFDALLYESSGIAYSWLGALPKVVPINSTPFSTGGIGPTTWFDARGVGLKAPAYYNSVADMVADTSVAVGRTTCSGGTMWKRVNSTAGISSYIVISGSVCVDDFLGFGASITADIDLALSFGINAYLKPMFVRILTVDAGVLYTRYGQVFDAGFATFRLRTDIVNLADITGPIFEQDSYSSIINAYIDGSCNSYKTRLDLITDFDLTPECHGIYTSRLKTNGGVFKRAAGIHLDNIFTNDTIRSGIVFVGDNHTFGTVDCGNTYCDHWLYFSNSKGVTGDIARCRGYFREEGIVLEGRASSPAYDTEIKKVEIINPALTTYPYRNAFFRLLNARDCEVSTALKMKVKIDNISVVSTNLGASPIDFDKRILFGDGWIVELGSASFEIALIKDSQGILSSKAAELYVGNVLVVGTGSVGGDFSNINFINLFQGAFSKSYAKVGVFSLRTNVPMPATSFALRNSGADAVIDEVHLMSPGIKPFKLFSTTVAISTSVGHLKSDDVISAAFDISGANENKFNLTNSNQVGSSASGSPQVGVNKIITLTASQSVGNFSDTCDGVSFIVVGNGTATIQNNSFIKTKSGATLTLPAGAASRFTRIGTTFCEV